MHLKPATGKPRQVGRDIVAHSFALGDMARVPVIGITGSQGKTMTGKLLFRLLTLHGWRCGLASSEGLLVDKRLLHRGDCANFENARRVLMNREVQTAIIENGARQLLCEGLAYERCEVGIITQIDWAEDLAAFQVHSHAERVKVYRTQMDVILPKGMAVLNADDPHIVELARHCDGQITWVCQTPGAPLIEAHLAQGQRVVSIIADNLTLMQGAERHTLCPLKAISGADVGANMAQTYNVLAAAAAAWALDLTPDLIQAGLLSFDPNTVVPQ
jgi:cyanophycin synthetase